MLVSLNHTDDMIVYAIGDVHGHVEELRQALDWCSKDADNHGKRGVVVLLGDYIDRGPQADAVLDMLISGPQDSHMTWMPIKGNHDDMMSNVWFDPAHPQAAAWWEHGGQQTLQSYGWDPVLHGIPDSLEDWIPEAHATFIKGLPLIVETENVIFVHAGLRPDVPINEQDPHDLMWIRAAFHRSSHDFGKPVVHGHTPDSQNPYDHGYRIGLDSGCFIGGKLSIAAFEACNPRPRLMVVDKFGPTFDEELITAPKC